LVVRKGDCFHRSVFEQGRNENGGNVTMALRVKRPWKAERYKMKKAIMVFVLAAVAVYAVLFPSVVSFGRTPSRQLIASQVESGCAMVQVQPLH